MAKANATRSSKGAFDVNDITTATALPYMIEFGYFR